MKLFKYAPKYTYEWIPGAWTSCGPLPDIGKGFYVAIRLPIFRCVHEKEYNHFLISHKCQVPTFFFQMKKLTKEAFWKCSADIFWYDYSVGTCKESDLRDFNG